MNPAPIRLMVPGRYSTSAGQVVNFTAAGLAALAKGYDRALFEAPIVAEPPRHDDPAGGWVHSLQFRDGALFAQPHQVEPVFGAAVAAGKFKKTAVSIYPADHPNNPTPGRPYLRHVGFDGIVAPAVPGLRPASPARFAAAPGLVFELDPARLDFTAPAV